MNQDSAQTIADVIRQEETTNERKIHLVRLAMLGLMIGMMTLARVTVGEVMHKPFLVGVPAALAYLILGLLLWRYLGRPGVRPALRYILMTLDLVYVAVALFGLSQIGDPYTFAGTTAAPPFLILFLLNALSGLRFDFRASVYCALASGLVVLGLGLYDAASGYFGAFPAAVLNISFKAAILAGTALASGYIGQRSKRLIVQATREQEEKKFIKGIFGRYATAEVVEDALRRGLQLGGEEREVTVLFADIRNFTGLAERLPPREVVDLLNAYFGEMVDVIARHGGTLNKFLGDGLLAIFGAPVSYGNDAERAVAAAREMLDRLVGFNRRQAEQGQAELRIGVGISTGKVVVGNVGSAERMEYTAIGDVVNLASRLDALNKELGTSILISESTYQRIADYRPRSEADWPQPSRREWDCQRLGPVQVPGKAESLWVYAVGMKMGRKDEG
jgi:class 3 adenylate cyclase